CATEEAEKLEQLRALDLGGRMKVLRTDARSVAVDIPADREKAERALRAAGLV
ncbi:MAG: 3-deoxy-manno-octulosonate cytidylyltransferase, partial [Gammaproteobacteria bacterium]|nr:3-deoxy-manno-octulosonate cytidylyltransferase [Gemmatimonadota bacterium]NIU74223.1 3-deoxy-manno-octulosonate cytidylyltransferase [Gammaproteobacteria bacterium]